MPDQVELDRGSEAELARALDEVVEQARIGLVGEQRPDGHWAYELEADATIPAEYIILNHFLGEIDDAREAKLARYLRRRQMTGGGWPLYQSGEANISASVKSYFALKLAGDDIDAPHMRRAREAILGMGGLPGCNVFTRITLAFFGIVPWHAAPLTRVEIMFAPRWFPMHIDKISYWSRTVMVPLLVLTARRARALNPRGVRLDELMPRERSARHWHLHNPTGRWPGALLIALDRMARPFEPLIPRRITDRAIAKAMDWVHARLNGEDGLGGIFPAMANACMAFHVLGYAANDPRAIVARQAIEKLIAEHDDEAYCQPCLSPVWDTGLAALAEMEAGRGASDSTRRACDWLVAREVMVVGDWASTRPDVAPSGWAFQYRNDHYPDVDDTAVVVMALQRTDERAYHAPINRAADWILAMQSENGGWGAFDADNTHTALNHIPFADHGALLDPPTADVTARCVGMLMQLGYDRAHPAIHRAIEFLKREQEPNGSWFGRWGTNFIYGTWSVLSAFNAAGEDPTAPYVVRAADWLESKQQADGGWGESCDTYWRERADTAVVPPLPSQTAWALLGLMAAGRLESDSVRRGIDFLIRAYQQHGGWHDAHYNAVGFPRVFYLKYHGYAKYFPLFALARYRNLKLGNATRTSFGL